MRVPVRPIIGAWPPALQRRLARFFCADPRVITDDDASADSFRTAMSAVHVGQTIKITGTDRHPESDAMILAHLDLANAVIVDMGASDGSTSVDLIRKLPGFESYTMADLFFHLSALRVGRRTVFYDPTGMAILVVGPRMIGWPSQSRPVRAVYSAVLRKAARSPEVRTDLLLLNPDARRILADDQRVSYCVHDVFQTWKGRPPTLIKAANLLRRLYFTDDQIRAAVGALHESLSKDGHLLVVDNPRLAGISERAGLYRKRDRRFVRIASTDHPAEIDDLIIAFGNDGLATS